MVISLVLKVGLSKDSGMLGAQQSVGSSSNLQPSLEGMTKCILQRPLCVCVCVCVCVCDLVFCLFQKEMLDQGNGKSLLFSFMQYTEGQSTLSNSLEMELEANFK
jgi:hypothetical protein